MSDPSPTNRKTSAASDYLARVLRLDPLVAGEQIIALRTRAFGLKPRVEQSSRPISTAVIEARRAAASKTLQEVRNQAWTGAPTELIERLDRLQLEGVPEIAAAVRRLRTLLACRSKLPRIAGRAEFDGEFFAILKQIFAAAPSDSSLIREQAIAAFRGGRYRKRGKRMISLLKQEVPELYQLESAWFESLLRQKKRSPSAAAFQRSSIGSFFTWVSDHWWLVWLLIIIGIRVLKSVLR